VRLPNIYAVVCKGSKIHADIEYTYVSKRRVIAQELLCTASLDEESCGPHRIVEYRPVNGRATIRRGK
jgi:hypothetical protein